MEVIPGSRVKFNVLIAGTPPLTIKWFKSNKEITTGVDCAIQKDDSSTSLELFFGKTSDSGDYICEISNDVGSDKCQATLFVKGCFPFSFLLISVILDSHSDSVLIGFVDFVLPFRTSEIHTKARRGVCCKAWPECCV